MSTRLQAPQGYEVVKVRGSWVILTVEQDRAGRVVGLGYIDTANTAGTHPPTTFRRRGDAIRHCEIVMLREQIAVYETLAHRQDPDRHESGGQASAALAQGVSY